MQGSSRRRSAALTRLWSGRPRPGSCPAIEAIEGRGLLDKGLPRGPLLPDGLRDLALGDRAPAAHTQHMERMEPDPYDDGPGKPVGDMQFVSPPSALPRACMHNAWSCCSLVACVGLQSRLTSETASRCQVASDCTRQLDTLAPGIRCIARSGRNTRACRQQEQPRGAGRPPRQRPDGLLCLVQEDFISYFWDPETFGRTTRDLGSPKAGQADAALPPVPEPLRCLHTDCSIPLRLAAWTITVTAAHRSCPGLPTRSALPPAQHDAVSAWVGGVL